MKTLTALVCVAVVCAIVSPAPTAAAEVELRLTRGEAENLIQILADENVDLTVAVVDMVSELIPGPQKIAVIIAVKGATVVAGWGAKKFRKVLEDNLGDDGVTLTLGKKGITIQGR